MEASKQHPKREPRIPARLKDDELYLGVPHRINQTASALLGEARDRYGESIERLVWAAIPWLPPNADLLPDPAKDVVKALIRDECSYGVHRWYLGFAAWLYLDLVEIYDDDVARQFWEKMPFLPKLADFHPGTWVVARGGKPY